MVLVKSNEKQKQALINTLRHIRANLQFLFESTQRFTTATGKVRLFIDLISQIQGLMN